jgi:hypothetical protein
VKGEHAENAGAVCSRSGAVGLFDGGTRRRATCSEYQSRNADLQARSQRGLRLLIATAQGPSQAPMHRHLCRCQRRCRSRSRRRCQRLDRRFAPIDRTAAAFGRGRDARQPGSRSVTPAPAFRRLTLCFRRSRRY